MTLRLSCLPSIYTKDIRTEIVVLSCSLNRKPGSNYVYRLTRQNLPLVYILSAFFDIWNNNLKCSQWFFQIFSRSRGLRGNILVTALFLCKRLHDYDSSYKKKIFNWGLAFHFRGLDHHHGDGKQTGKAWSSS